MKITSTQVTIALGLVAVGVVYVIGRKVAGSAASVADYAVQQITPWNPDNVFATVVNKVGGALVTEPDGAGKNADGSWSLGGFAFDVMNPRTVQDIKDLSGPAPSLPRAPAPPPPPAPPLYPTAADAPGAWG